MPDAALTQYLSDALLPNPPEKLGVAISGGGDSTALLLLSAKFCAAHSTELFAVTVNHNLRPEAAQEAAQVAQLCRDLGVPHEVLQWHDTQPSGNLQGKAREGRYQLMADWALSCGITQVALGHTADDQAETVLLNIARRSGADGLSGMRPRRLSRGVTWLRPLLPVQRETLRAYLRGEGIGWAEDPSNEDMSYDRIKARKAMAALAGLGIDANVLSEVAGNMAEVRKALNWQTFTAAREITTINRGAVVLCERRLRILPEEIQRRLMLRALAWVGGAGYPPRRAAMKKLLLSITARQTSTLAGCQVVSHMGLTWVFREYQAVRDTVANAGALWDGRWRLQGQHPREVLAGEHIRALGEEGVLLCKDWRDTGLPRAMLLSAPSQWAGGELIAAPAAGFGKNWHAHLDEGDESFYSGFLLH
ncbi:MAG: tRNA lysidine(34) synthetase TilS [Sulfitobacter sp.]